MEGKKIRRKVVAVKPIFPTVNSVADTWTVEKFLEVITSKGLPGTVLVDVDTWVDLWNVCSREGRDSRGPFLDICGITVRPNKFDPEEEVELVVEK